MRAVISDNTHHELREGKFLGRSSKQAKAAQVLQFNHMLWTETGGPKGGVKEGREGGGDVEGKRELVSSAVLVHPKGVELQFS